MKHATVLGGNGAITTLSMSTHNPAYAQQESWNEVKNSDFSTRLNYWFANLQISQDSLAKAVALVSFNIKSLSIMYHADIYLPSIPEKHGCYY